MKKERLLLLVSSIFGFLYVLMLILISFVKKDFFTNNIVMDIVNISLYTLGFISSSLLLYFSLTKKDISNKRWIILLCSIILFIINIISGILGFISYRKLNNKKLRELPKLEIMHNYKWYVYLIAFGICIGIMFGLSHYFTKRIHSLIAYLFIFSLLVFIFRKDLKRDFKYFKEYFREYSSIVFKLYGISLLLLIILSISIRLYSGLETSSNQSELNELFKSSKILVVVLALIYAPVAEELLFRGIFRKIINNKWIFILTSGFLFGLAHILEHLEIISELMFLLVYGSLGCFLSAIYYKTNNIFANIMFHFLQNSLAVIGMFLLYYLGM